MPTFFVELNPEIPDAYFESNEFSTASDQLDAIAKSLGLPSHFELFSYADQNDLCPPEYQETEIPWFDPQVGLSWLDAVVKYIQAEPTSVPNSERLLSDFTDCINVLNIAKSKGSKWHFAMDI